MEKISNTRKQKQNKNADDNLTPLLTALVNQCILEDERNLKIYELPMIEEHITEQFRIVSNGPMNTKLDTKKILLIGETGTGKTTLMNAIINFIYGVEYENNIRFKVKLDDREKLAQNNKAMGQTSCVSVYKIGYQTGMRVNFNVILIDTPGFGDQGGIQHDQKIAKQIECLFSSGASEINSLNAVCFVVKSSSVRFTPSESYVFDSVLRLFGKDIESNISFMVTFMDSLGAKPGVLDAIKQSGIVCNTYFKFNNSSLYSATIYSQENYEDDKAIRQIEKITWTMNYKSLTIFFNHTDEINERPLILTREVMSVRNHMELEVCKIQDDIRRGVSKLRVLEDLNSVLLKHQQDLDLDKDFKCQLTECTSKPVKLPAGIFATNCQKCKRTCHDNCNQVSNKDFTMFCFAMDNNFFPPRCRVCDNNCTYKEHSIDPFKYEPQETVVEINAEYLKSRFQISKTDLNKAKIMIHQAKEEFLTIQLEVMQSIFDLKKTNDRLSKIALKNDPSSQLDYIDKLIYLEGSERKPGYQDRIKQLKDVKDKLIFLLDIIKDGKDPFQPYLKQLELNLENVGIRFNISDQFKQKLKAFCEQLKPQI